MTNSVKEAAQKSCAQTCSIDLYDLDETDEKLIKLATGRSREDIMNDSIPVVVLKSNCAFKTVNKDIVMDEEKMRRLVKSHVQSEHIKNVNQLADRLKENTHLGDCLVLYYLPIKEGESAQKSIQEYEEDNIIPLNLLRGETDRICVITDEALAKTCRLEPNTYYSYFKPSYINGFENLVDKDLNIEYLQAFEGICRDEFQPNTDYISSNDFIKSIGENEMQFTEALVDEHFDKAFHRTTNTEFIMNPHFETRWLSGNAEIPQCFIYVPDQYMRKYIFEIKQAIQDYQGTFEFVYTNDYDMASKYLYLDEYPDVMPYFLIVDKTKKLPIRSINDPPIKKFSEVVQDIEEGENSPLNDKKAALDPEFYYAKYKHPIFLQGMVKEIENFLENYLEGKIDPFYQTEKMVQRSNVKEICGDNFEREIVRNPNVEQCIIEVFKHDCPSCMYNGKVFNAFSKKLEKHGMLDKLPCYRLCIDNKVPYLGAFFYSPIYYYLKKEDGKVTEIAILDIPVKYDQFIGQVKKYSGLEEELKKIDLVPKLQVRYHFNLTDLDEDFDIDRDLKDQAEEEAEREKQAKEELEKSEKGEEGETVAEK